MEKRTSGRTLTLKVERTSQHGEANGGDNQGTVRRTLTLNVERTSQHGEANGGDNGGTIRTFCDGTTPEDHAARRR